MLLENDFYDTYPVVHDDADLSKVYERLAWRWRMDRTPLLAPFAKINFSAEAVKLFNASLMFVKP